MQNEYKSYIHWQMYLPVFDRAKWAHDLYFDYFECKQRSYMFQLKDHPKYNFLVVPMFIAKAGKGA